MHYKNLHFLDVAHLGSVIFVKPVFELFNEKVDTKTSLELAVVGIGATVLQI